MCVHAPVPLFISYTYLIEHYLCGFSHASSCLNVMHFWSLLNVAMLFLYKATSFLLFLFSSSSLVSRQAAVFGAVWTVLVGWLSWVYQWARVCSFQPKRQSIAVCQCTMLLLPREAICTKVLGSLSLSLSLKTFFCFVPGVWNIC